MIPRFCIFLSAFFCFSFGAWAQYGTYGQFQSAEAQRLDEALGWSSMCEQKREAVLIEAVDSGMFVDAALFQRLVASGYLSLEVRLRILAHALERGVHPELAEALLNWALSPYAYIDFDIRAAIIKGALNGNIDTSEIHLDGLIALLQDEALSEVQRSALRDALGILLEKGSACYESPDYDELVEHGLDVLLDTPEVFLEKKLKYILDPLPTGETPRTPQVLHHIWLTHPDAPREMRAEDIEQVVADKALFPDVWEHIVWVNDISLIPSSVEALEAAGITVMPMAHHATVLPNYALIEKLIDQQAWGIASDALRFSIIEHFGGVYSDLNYVFERDLEDAVYHYDFFAKEYAVGGMATNNCFLAAKPKHPILTRVTELVARNFGPNKPAYIANSYDPHAPTFTTVDPLWLAYYQKANDGTVDALFPKFTVEDEKPGSVILTEYNSGDFYTRKNEALREALQTEYPGLLEACPRQFRVDPVATYLYENHVCLEPSLYFGHDGTNGRTWI